MDTASSQQQAGTSRTIELQVPVAVGPDGNPLPVTLQQLSSQLQSGNRVAQVQPAEGVRLPSGATVVQLPLPTATSRSHIYNANPTSTPRCLVCSDKSSGVHYGVLACEGCKVNKKTFPGLIPLKYCLAVGEEKADKIFQ